MSITLKFVGRNTATGDLLMQDGEVVVMPTEHLIGTYIYRLITDANRAAWQPVLWSPSEQLSHFAAGTPKARFTVRGPIYGDPVWIVGITGAEGDSHDGRGETLDEAIVAALVTA